MNWRTALNYTKAHVALIGATLTWVVATFPHGPAAHYCALALALGTALGVWRIPNRGVWNRAQVLRNPVYPTGKRPARRDVRDLPMVRYLDGGIPAVPAGPLGIIPGVGKLAGLIWGMLGNARYGDCVWAGGDHETMIWTAEGTGTPAVFTDATALADYAAVTGFNPNVPSSDQGTDVRKAYSYRKTTGLADANGNRHRLGAYLAVRLDEAHLQAAIWLFGVVGLGIMFPDSAMTQFNQGQPWDVVPGTPTPTDGHYVPLVGYDPAKRLYYVITWGRLQAVTWQFLQTYADEHYALLSEEMLNGGIAVNGLNYSQLQTDLANLNSTTPPPGPAPAPGDADQALAVELRRLMVLKSTSATAKADFQAWLTVKGL